MADPIFCDDFDKLDTALWPLTRWPYTPKADATCSLPSNGELEGYINRDGALAKTIRPWTVASSILTLTCDKQPDGSFTSGMLNTYGSFTPTYGYFEMRAKLPAGNGFWPAWWLVGRDSWPPEIDMLEAIMRQPKQLDVGTHGDHDGGTGVTVPDMSLDFHTYACDWQNDFIVWSFDGLEIYRKPTPSDCHVPMYMILNLALGGPWAGAPDATTPFPGKMQIDYVKVWQTKPPLPVGKVHAVPNPWSTQVIADFAPGDKINLAFAYERIELLFSDKGTTVYVQTVGDQLTCACVVLGARLSWLG